MKKEIRKYLREIGRRGGLKGGAKNKLKGKGYFAQIGKLGAKARWGNKHV